MLFVSNTKAIDLYAGVDYFWSDIRLAGEKTHPTMASINLGAEIWQQILLEVQYGQSINEDSIYRLNFELEESQAIYLHFLSEDNDYWLLDLSIGYASTDFSGTGPVDTYNDTETYKGFSWGAFAVKNIESIPGTRFKIGYQSLFNDDELHIKGWVAGLSYHF